VTWQNFTDVSGICCLIALMMEAARTSETSVNFYQTTRRYNPDDSHLQAVECLHLIFWPGNQRRFHCHTAKPEPDRRVTINRVPLQEDEKLDACPRTTGYATLGYDVPRVDLE
jgi:hypothetical protein